MALDDFAAGQKLREMLCLRIAHRERNQPRSLKKNCNREFHLGYGTLICNLLDDNLGAVFADNTDFAAALDI